MKIFHMWNTAGVGSLIAKYTSKYCGVESDVTYMKYWDHFGLTSIGTAYDYGYKRSLALARMAYHLTNFIRSYEGWDILHIHDMDRYLFPFKFIHPWIPKIIHYHGTRIRDRWDDRKNLWKYADRILVSTPDLLDGAPSDATYIPNTYDDDLFNPEINTNKIPKALHVSYFADDIAQEYAENQGIELVIHDREKNPLPHDKFAELINTYAYYIDVKRDVETKSYILEGTSITGLEALAAGATVIDWKGDLNKGVPNENKPVNFARKIMEVYENCLHTRGGVRINVP